MNTATLNYTAQYPLALNLIEEFSHDLAMEITALNFIKENDYCRIYSTKSSGKSVIIKKYKGSNSSLALAESRAIDFYHAIAESDIALIGSGTIRLNLEKNILCMGFVEGQTLSRLIYRGNWDADVRERSIRIMKTLGRLLREFYDLTYAPGVETSPFIFEYFSYCSKRLEEHPVLGSVLFRGYCDSAEKLSDDLRRARIIPSFIHGDFVSRNIHIAGERVGLIDFANTNDRSHLLNDLYNLSFALKNMVTDRAYKKALWSALSDGIGNFSFPAEVHRFYYEYHRRRWLMLKINSVNPVSWTQAVRGLLTFAKPFSLKADCK